MSPGDVNERSRKIAREGLKRFPDSPLLKIRLAWAYLAESENFGPLERYRETIEIAHNSGREVVDAKNKSRFLIYQNLKLMAHATHGGVGTSIARFSKAA